MWKTSHALFLVLAVFLIVVGLQIPESIDSAEQPDAGNQAVAVDAPVEESAEETSPVLPLPDPEPASLDYLQLFTQPQTRSFARMVEERTIRALVVRSRTFYFLDGAVQRGLSYDGLQAFEAFVNKRLKTRTLKLRVHFIPVTRDQLIPALLAGYGDVAAANITITPERQSEVDFSIPMKREVREILVTGPAGKDLQGMEDLPGSRIHVRHSSSYYESLTTLNKQFELAGLRPIELKLVDEHMEDEDLLEMVNAGLIPGIIMDSHKAEFWRQIFDDINLQDNVVLREGADIAWAFRQDSPELAKVVNDFMKKNREGTLLGNILLKRYLEQTRYVENALTSPEMKKFNATAPLFQKYANQYEFDWLMIMSQAYQESRLDHSVRSKSGAVGIMQIKPSTAADKNVNIPDISNLDNNIHAGIKYLRFIRNRYFESEAMDELNKTLFSFAAYNAGPARITKIRNETKRQGLNPDIWFDNVEVTAAKKIGREPVQYVSNIYKYWVAYRLSQEHPVGISPPVPGA